MVNPAHLLDPSCPWYIFKVLRLPQVKWCEAQVCSWIEEPANTWSNLGYILAGVAMIRMGRRLMRRDLQFFGPAGVIVGVGSWIYHASNSFILQLFDFFGMYLFCYLLIFLNLDRGGIRMLRNSRKPLWVAAIATTLLTALVDLTSFPIQMLVFIQILAILVQEAFLFWKAIERIQTKYLLLSALFTGIAATCSFLDLKRISCEPENHVLQGHALWHLFGAAALFLSFLHHRQFDEI